MQRFFRTLTDAQLLLAYANNTAISVAAPRDEFECIEIGPRSDFPELRLLPGTITPSPKVSNLSNPTTSTNTGTYDPLDVALHVAVGSPYCGPPISGPFHIFPPGAEWIYGGSGERMFGALPISGGYHLDLTFHRKPPLHIMRRRPDYWRHIKAHAQETVAETTVCVVPAHGREDLIAQIDGELVGAAAGTATWRIYGMMHRATLISTAANPGYLLETVAHSADTLTTVEYEGKFDAYRFTLQGATDGLYQAQLDIRMRDKYQ